MWIFPYIVLILLNLADFGATSLLIDRQGFDTEANPYLYHWIVLANSVWPIFAVKMIAVVFFGVVIFGFRKPLVKLGKEKLIRNAMWAMNAGLFVVSLIGILLLHGVQFNI